MSQQVYDPSWICLHFEKYSYNTSRTGARKYDWTHVGPRNDLELVIRDVHVTEVGGRNIGTMMQVTAGSEVLETQDLRELVAHYRNHKSLPESDCPVRVVTRPPVWLAMVFPKTNTTVQRVQFKFNTESDFRRVVAMFSELGLPTRDSPLPRTIAASRPPPSSSPAPSVLSSVTPVPTLLTAPSTVSDSSSLYRYPNLKDDLSNPLNKPQFNAPQLSEGSFMAELQPSVILPYSTTYRPAHDISTATTSLELATRSSFPRQFSIQEIPKQTSLFLSQMDPESLHCLNHTAAPSQKSAVELPDPTLAYTTLHPRQANALDGDANLRQYLTSPFFSTHVNDLQQSQRSCKELSSPETRSQNVVTLDTSTSDSIEHPCPQAPNVDTSRNLWIPPKRELPFLKTQTAQRSRSLSVFDLPPLPKPEPITRSGSVLYPPLNRIQEPITPVASSVKRRVAERKAPVSIDTNEILPSEKATTNSVSDGAVIDPRPKKSLEEESPLAVKSAAARRQSSALSNLQSKATSTSRKRTALPRLAPVPKRLKMVDQGTQTHSISNSDDVTTSAKEVGKVPQLVPDSPSVISPPESFLNDIDDFISTHKNRPAPKELWDTPGYASLDAEERKITMNNFICDNLDDANFLQLCKDVEFAWRRIGLGL